MTPAEVEATWTITEHGVATPMEVEAAIVHLAGDDAALAYRLEGYLAAQAAEIERMREALEIIAGKRQCIDNLMGNADLARQVLTGEA